MIEVLPRGRPEDPNATAALRHKLVGHDIEFNFWIAAPGKVVAVVWAPRVRGAVLVVVVLLGDAQRQVGFGLTQEPRDSHFEEKAQSKVALLVDIDVNLNAGA